ncbi:MAG: heat-inducible transcription repressor HrcA [Peptoniphilus sp. oral taxon 375]|nr:heat-inducible transcription repressor HrcA [Peptoniphilus sp. oral taxon 375]
MDERKIRILNAIIHSYLEIPIPVGSRKISKEYDLGVSSATIRNEMSDLEDLGYLNKPHTSAGRIPSDKAYRFFVEEWKDQKRAIALDQKLYIVDLLKKAMYSTEELLSQTAKLLNEITRFPAFVLAPSRQDRILKQIELLPIHDKFLLVILVGDQGIVEKNVLRLPNKISEEDLKSLKYSLNKNLCGVDFSSFDSVHIQLTGDMVEYKGLITAIVDLAIHLTEKVEKVDVYSQGLTSILDLEEFQDFSKARDVIRFMEDPRNIVEIFPKDTDLGDVHVIIGSENKEEVLHENSLVTGTYAIDSNRIGQIGVIGPVRMDYPWIIDIVGTVAKNLSKSIQVM